MRYTVSLFQPASGRPGGIYFPKEPSETPAFHQAAILLELHASLMAYRALEALTAVRPVVDVDMRMGLNFLLAGKSGKMSQLASWGVAKKGTQFDDISYGYGDGYFVSLIEENNGKELRGNRWHYEPNENYQRALGYDDAIRRSLGDFDAKGNTVLHKDFVAMFDWGAAIAKTMTDHFPPQHYRNQYDNSMLQFEDDESTPGIVSSKGYHHWVQANPFNWSPAKGSPGSESFASNLSRVPHVGNQTLYEALLDGREDFDLPTLIADTLINTEIVARTNLDSLEMPLTKLNTSVFKPLMAAAKRHLEKAGEWKITDGRILLVFESQKEYLKEIAGKQLAIVGNCKRSKSCLLAYLLQSITASDEYVPVIEDPSQFAGQSLPYVMGYVFGKLSKEGRKKYAPAIRLLAQAVNRVQLSAVEKTGLEPPNLLLPCERKFVAKSMLPSYALRKPLREKPNSYNFMSWVRGQIKKAGVGQAVAVATRKAANDLFKSNRLNTKQPGTVSPVSILANPANALGAFKSASTSIR